MAARILDLVGIVVNRQTIPGDTSALRPSGIRLGTTWLTQRGITAADIDALGDIIADVLGACLPFSLTGRVRPLARAKVDFDELQTAQNSTAEMAARLGIDTDAAADGYPHFYTLDTDADENCLEISVCGAAACDFLHSALTSDVAALNDGESQPTHLLEKDGAGMASGSVTRVSADEYLLNLAGKAKRAVAWLRSLSDGYALVDDADVQAKLPGPVAVHVLGEGEPQMLAPAAGYDQKTYHIGMSGPIFFETSAADLPKFEPDVAVVDMMRETPLHSLHLRAGRKDGAIRRL